MRMGIGGYMSNQRMQSGLRRLSNSQLVRYLLLFALAWAIAQVLGYFASVLAILICSAILALLLSYPVAWLQRYMSHGIAVTVVFLLGLAVLSSLAFTVGLAILSQAQQLIASAPEQVTWFVGELEKLEQFLSQWNFNLNFAAMEDYLRKQAISGFGLGVLTLQRLLSSFVEGILIAVVTLFMLLDGERVWRFFIQKLPEPFRSRLPKAIRRNFLGFFWGRFLLSVFFGVTAFIIFLILQLPYSLVLAAIAGIFDLIPGIGATLGISLAALIVLPQGIGLSLKIIIVCVLIQQIQENLLMPRIMKGSVNLNPVVLFTALLIGAKLAGLFGLFLAIPVTGTLLDVFEVEELQG
jgi:predicted PurR-regulated permease PerM